MSVCIFASVGEALGAIGDPVVLPILEEYSKDPVIEVLRVLLLKISQSVFLPLKYHQQQ